MAREGDIPAPEGDKGQEICKFCGQSISSHAEDCSFVAVQREYREKLDSTKRAESITPDFEEAVKKGEITFEQQMKEIEAGFAESQEPGTEQAASSFDRERASRYNIEFQADFFEISNLLDEVNTTTTREFLNAHPELPSLSKEFGDLLKKYLALVQNFDKQQAKNPEYLSAQFGLWHMLKLDLEHFRALLADYKHS